MSSNNIKWSELSDKAKVLMVIKSADDDGDCGPNNTCEGCPLHSACDEWNVDVRIVGKAWLFDHGWSQANPSVMAVLGAPVTPEPASEFQLPPPVAGWSMASTPKTDYVTGWSSGVLLPKLPSGLVPLDISQYRDQMKVRVFAKNFQKCDVDELPGEFLLGDTGERWWLLGPSTIEGYGFVDDEDLGRCRLLAKGDRLLTDILIIGCEEDVLHPKAHKKRNFRKLKT